MIASFHLAEVGKRAGLRLLRTRLGPGDLSGLRYGALAVAAPLGAGAIPGRTRAAWR